MADAGMTKYDLWREVQNQVKAQLRELKGQTMMELTIQEVRNKIQRHPDGAKARLVSNDADETIRR